MKIQITEQSPDDMQKYYNAPTPEIDAMASTMFPDGLLWVQAEDAWKLERERDELSRDFQDFRANARHRCGQLQDERDELRDAVRNLRNVQGRHHTQIATERLFALLPENVTAQTPTTGASADTHINHQTT